MSLHIVKYACLKSHVWNSEANRGSTPHHARWWSGGVAAVVGAAGAPAAPIALHRNASEPDASASGPYCSQGQRCCMRRSAEALAGACLQQRPLWTHTRRHSRDTRVSAPLPSLTADVQMQKKESAHCGTFTRQMLRWYGQMWANGIGLSYIWIFICNYNAFFSE